MATRPFIPPYSVIKNGDMSGNLTSSPSNVQQLSICSYSMVWTGSPTGTFTVEASNDYSVDASGKVANAGTWNTLPTAPTISASGSSGNGIYDIALTGIVWIRLVYNSSGGSGSVNALFAGKVS